MEFDFYFGLVLAETNDFSSHSLRIQLQLFHYDMQRTGIRILISDIIKYFNELSKPQTMLMCEVSTLLQIVSERSFSAMKRVQTYLRSTMTESRLNDLMLLHIHKDRCDNLDLVRVSNLFAATQNRQHIFGTFTQLDMSRSYVRCKDVGVQCSLPLSEKKI